MRFFDYQKVKDAERKKATELFGSAAEPSALASKVGSIHLLKSSFSSTLTWLREQIMGIKSKTFDVPSTDAAINGGKNYRVKLTEKEKKRVEELIRNAKSLQEITKLEKELNEGRIPGGAIGDSMEE